MKSFNLLLTSSMPIAFYSVVEQAIFREEIDLQEELFKTDITVSM